MVLLYFSCCCIIICIKLFIFLLEKICRNSDTLLLMCKWVDSSVSYVEPESGSSVSHGASQKSQAIWLWPWVSCSPRVSPEEGNGKPVLSALYLENLEKGCHKSEVWRKEEKGTTEDEMVGQCHQSDQYEFGPTPGGSGRQEGLACSGPWGHEELGTTKQQQQKSELTWWHTITIYEM